MHIVACLGLIGVSVCGCGRIATTPNVGTSKLDIHSYTSKLNIHLNTMLKMEIKFISLLPSGGSNFDINQFTANFNSVKRKAEQEIDTYDSLSIPQTTQFEKSNKQVKQADKLFLESLQLMMKGIEDVNQTQIESAGNKVSESTTLLLKVQRETLSSGN